MSLTLRSMSVIALMLAISPASVSAQQLVQPESIEPWTPPRVWKTPAVSTANRTIAPPQLVFDSITQAPGEVVCKAPLRSLPMVETESFALLGQISAEKFPRGGVGSTAETIEIAPSEGITESFPHLGFLRAYRHRTAVQR